MFVLEISAIILFLWIFFYSIIYNFVDRNRHISWLIYSCTICFLMIVPPLIWLLGIYPSTHDYLMSVHIWFIVFLHPEIFLNIKNKKFHEHKNKKLSRFNMLFLTSLVLAVFLGLSLIWQFMAAMLFYSTFSAIYIYSAYQRLHTPYKVYPSS